MSETLAIETWLYETLSDPDTGILDLATGVYADQAPEDAPFPYVVYQLREGTDMPVMGASARAVRAHYLIRAVDHSPSKVAAAEIADAIDDLIEKASGSVTGATIIGAIRNQPFEMVETQGGETYMHVGGIYRVYAGEG